MGEVLVDFFDADLMNVCAAGALDRVDDWVCCFALGDVDALLVERTLVECFDDAIESSAAEWLVRHDRGLTPAQQDEFLSWLTASAAHRESFERHRQMWGDFNALKQWRPEHGTTPNPDLLARHRRPAPWRRPLPLLLAAAAAIALTFWLVPAPSSRADASLTFETAVYRQEKLPDGSVLDLNRGAHVVVQFSATERRVLLVQGGRSGPGSSWRRGSRRRYEKTLSLLQQL